LPQHVLRLPPCPHQRGQQYGHKKCNSGYHHHHFRQGKAFSPAHPVLLNAGQTFTPTLWGTLSWPFIFTVFPRFFHFNWNQALRQAIFCREKKFFWGTTVAFRVKLLAGFGRF
jgi:hypothetical protein